MRDNIITIEMQVGKLNCSSIAYQYDYGQILKIEGIPLPDAYEVHFSNRENGESKTSIGNSEGVMIPDEFFLSGENILVWLFLHADEDDGETVCSGIIPIAKRARPTDIEPTPVQQDVITQAIAALNTAVAEAEEYARQARESAESIPEVATTEETQDMIDDYYD